MSKPAPSTLKELESSGYRPRTVKDELRANLRRELAAGRNPFPGIHGYERTVLPALHNAVLSRHDVLANVPRRLAPNVLRSRDDERRRAAR